MGRLRPQAFTNIELCNISKIFMQPQECESFEVVRIVRIKFKRDWESILIVFLMAQQPPVGHGLLTVEASRSHSDTPHSAGLLWTSDQPDTETST
jgi:hypothetical protein